jgi:2-C-methyl-D-erythritol 4-phosphate cytidylyltransferase
MTRPGETFYRLVPDASKRNQASGRRRTIDNQAQDYDMAATFPGVCAVVPAAGFGRRMQTECPKQYLSIGNKTILEHAVAALLANACVQRVVIAVSPGDIRFSQLPLATHPQITVVDGGAERADSVLAGLQALPEAAVGAGARCRAPVPA